MTFLWIAILLLAGRFALLLVSYCSDDLEETVGADGAFEAQPVAVPVEPSRRSRRSARSI